MTEDLIIRKARKSRFTYRFSCIGREQGLENFLESQTVTIFSIVGLGFSGDNWILLL